MIFDVTFSDREHRDTTSGVVTRRGLAEVAKYLHCTCIDPSRPQTRQTGPGKRSDTSAVVQSTVRLLRTVTDTDFKSNLGKYLVYTVYRPNLWTFLHWPVGVLILLRRVCRAMSE